MTKLKNFRSILFFFLLIGCGFTPILKNIDFSKVKIKEITYVGDKELVFRLKQSLAMLDKKQDQTGLIININISKSISSTSKNTLGITTEEGLALKANLEIKSEKTIVKTEVTSSKTITVTGNQASDQEKRDIEILSLINDVTQKIKIQILLASRK